MIWLARQFINLLIDLGINICTGARFALFLPADREMLRVNLAQALFLLLVSFSLSFAYDYFDSAPNNYFNIYGLNYQATLYLLFFFSIIFIAQVQNNLASLLTVVILFQAIVPVIWVVYICLLRGSEYQNIFDQKQAAWIVFILYLIWYLAIAFRLLNNFYNTTVTRTLILVTIYAIINIGSIFVIPNQPLWYAYYDPSREEDKKPKLDVEAIYYSQAPILESHAETLLRQRAGIIDLYFLGFAGDADEDVFMNEASHAKSLFDERFDTRGRSMLLVNNIETVQTHPLANLHNLDLALDHIAARMDTEEDILFLFLTSHGSEDHTLAVNFSPLQMNNVDSESIRFSLEKAGIKWRIIIISACYSGAFINSLKDDYTLIITASSEDRNSFGCGHDGHFTYFGEAYFYNHLKHEQSFISAFHRAKKDIENREEKEGIDHSHPQIFIGKDIEQKLDVFTNQLKQTEKNNWAISKQ